MELKLDELIDMLLAGIEKIGDAAKPIVEKIGDAAKPLLGEAGETAREAIEKWIEQLLELAGPYREYLIWILPALAVLFIFMLVARKRTGKADRTEAAKPIKKAEPKEAKRKEEPQPEAVEKEAKAAPQKEEPPRPEPVKEPTGIIRNIRTGLEKTRKALSGSVDILFSGGRKLDEDMLEELEELLITSDVGVKTTFGMVETISERSSEISSAADLKSVLKDEISKLINIELPESAKMTSKPHVIMVIGVNGVGKTTTIGKLSARFSREGKKVMIVAADTFRAAAADQLNIWAERSGADIIRHKDNSDPAAVTYDGMEAAVARGVDVVIVDTAGRLHTKKNLMEELKKIERTITSKIPEAPHETLMVVDATTGQNALSQAQLFNESIKISGIALTKLDGTAKGGIVIGITNNLNVPLRYIGVGEQIDDLQDFNPVEFADALF